MMRSQLQSAGRLARPSTSATSRIAGAARLHISNNNNVAASKTTAVRSLATRTIPRAPLPALASSSQYRSFSSTRIQHGEMIITVPPMAESINEGTVSNLSKQVGDRVEADEEVASIETDKIDVAVNATEAGTIVELFVAEGDTVEVGAKVARVETGGAAPPKDDKPAPKKEESKPDAGKPAAPAPEQKKEPEAPKKDESKPAAPAPAPQQQQQQQKKPAETAPVAQAAPFGATGLFSRAERTEKMTRMRKTIASKLKQSQNITASLTTINEVDMSALMQWRARNKEDVMKRHGVRLGYMGAFTKATCLAAQQVPQMNASIDTDKEIITYRDYVDISIAVSAPKGLITPVLRNVESLDIIGIERGVAELAGKARDGKLTMPDLEGGNFSISNPGIFGSLFGTPVINYPQAAVFNMNGIKERPVIVDGKLEIRPMMYITVTYDHRLIDGREAISFLNIVKNYIEDPAKLLLA